MTRIAVAGLGNKEALKKLKKIQGLFNDIQGLSLKCEEFSRLGEPWVQ